MVLEIQAVCKQRISKRMIAVIKLKRLNDNLEAEVSNC